MTNHDYRTIRLADSSIHCHSLDIRLCVSVLRGSFSRRRSNSVFRQLVGSGTEQELDDVAFVRLQPIELDGGNRSDVQAVDVRGVGQLALPLPGCSVIAVQTSVGPIDSIIFSCGHSTTVTNGNMYSFLADGGGRAIRSE